MAGGPSPGEEDKGDFATPDHQLRPYYAFSVARCIGNAGHRWCGCT